ncbi:glycosyl transferases group 1,glycosyl transferase group 1 [Bifidobacterium dolichotidis]|uniref:Glycosyl transferases group 1,glycosyl transferase group 1 n=1 Tax=Bifidobacterium dolichotidis TaxID=2306976 RepID=A0A430FRM6_9BIFI|nr:glycosyltransferase family 1 protein [Bifidobacterium dolichotidis]RSX55531.1 glycosyl transferases group 1,glycosyl transferase group 1 [Bifidobacterium dolichotidis]
MTCRVLNLITSLDRGGAETMIMNYYRSIDRDKVQFDFLVNREKIGAYEEEIESLGGKIYRMGPMYPWRFSEYKHEFRSFLRDHPEYSIIHSHLEERSYFPLRIAKEENVPVRIAHAHNVYRGFNAKTIFRDYFRYKLPPYPTDKFACSKEAGIWLYGKDAFLNGEVTIVKNAIDSFKFIYNEKIRESVRSRLQIDDQLVLGNVGRLAPQKNQSFLLDIFAELKKIHKNSKLLIVGDGDLKQELVRKAESLQIIEDIIFTGSVSDVNDYLQAMDVFVLPSHFEGLPVSLVEAQAAGLQCIVSDQVTREVDFGKYLTYVSLKQSPQDWAKICIEKSQDQRRSDMDLIVRSGFDIHETAKKLQSFYLSR